MTLLMKYPQRINSHLGCIYNVTNYTNYFSYSPIALTLLTKV